MKTIQYPDGITMLMQNLWLCHKAGIKQSGCNVFMVELPQLTEEELAEARRTMGVLKTTRKNSSEPGYDRFCVVDAQGFYRIAR